ncbi:hypothetical protein Nmel_006217 [Mimus melanotis]
MTLYSSLLSRFMDLMYARAVLCNEPQLLCNKTIACLVLSVCFRLLEKRSGRCFENNLYISQLAKCVVLLFLRS